MWYFYLNFECNVTTSFAIDIVIMDKIVIDKWLLLAHLNSPVKYGMIFYTEWTTEPNWGTYNSHLTINEVLKDLKI